MSEPTYTEIPDTADTTYWESKITDHSTIFIPKDKERHQQLKKKAWVLIQALLDKKNRKASGY